MEFQTIYLHFKSPVHFGDSSRGNESSKIQFSADSLWGAICFALSKLLPKNEFESLLEEFSNIPVPFRISSTYPFQKKKGETKLFLPRPLFLIENPDFTSELDPKLAKKIKTSKFIPLSLFEKWINQAEDNTIKGRIPLICFKRNHSKTYAVIEFSKLLYLME